MSESTNNPHRARPVTPLPLDIPAAQNGLRLAAIDHSNVAAEGGVPDLVESQASGEENEKEAPVTWMSLPHKKQLIILTLARLSEPLVQTSLQVMSLCFLPSYPHF